jgi:hypothetical protein
VGRFGALSGRQIVPPGAVGDDARPQRRADATTHHMNTPWNGRRA